MAKITGYLLSAVLGATALISPAQAEPSETQLKTLGLFVAVCGSSARDYSLANKFFEVAGFTEETVDKNFFADPDGKIGGVAIINAGGDPPKLVPSCAVYFEGTENADLRAFLADRFSQFSLGTVGNDDYWRFPAFVLKKDAPKDLELMMVFSPKEDGPFPGKTLLSVADYNALAPQ